MSKGVSQYSVTEETAAAYDSILVILTATPHVPATAGHAVPAASLLHCHEYR